MPARIGRYEIVRPVGHGGMAVVYEARDPALDRRVALKLLKHDPNPALVARLQREAAAAAQLRHPNIVAVHDVGEADGSHFIAMEFVEGPTLAAAQPSMSERKRIEAVETLARAVDHAHRSGIVHRDLKPQNVLIESATGRLFLTDFGLARSLDGEPLTRTGTAVGTPCYMSPEQVRGESRLVGPATDVWSLGVILYELLADRLPFAGPTPAQIYHGILAEEPAPLRHVHPDLATICLHALDKTPARRYPSAAAFADDLRRALAGEPILARPSSLAEKTWRRLRRNAPASVLAALLALVVLSGAALLAAQALRDRAASGRHARDAETILASAATIDDLIRADDHARLAGDADLRYRVNRRLGEHALATADYGLARTAFAACHALRPAEDLRPLVDQARTAETRRRAARLTAVLEDLRAGLSRAGRPAGAPLVEDYVFECVAFADDQTVRMLAAALAPMGERGPGARWTQEERDVMLFCFRVLGRLGRADTVKPLAALLPRLSDPELIVECAHALCNSRSPEALAPLMAARERVGGTSTTWHRIERLLDRVPIPPLDGAASAEDYNSRGVTREEQGDADGALADFNRAIELDPRHVSAHNNRALARRVRGDLEGSLADFDRAVELDPGRPMSYVNRSITRRLLRDFAGAVADCDRALEIDPRNAQALCNRALARDEAGDFAGAIRDCTAAIAIDPTLAIAWNNRSVARRNSGDFDGAVEDADRALERDPRLSIAFVNRGLARRRRGDDDGAMEDYTRAIELEPRQALAYNNRGVIRRLRGDLDGALEDFTRTIALEPRYAGAHLNRGHIRLARNDPEGALADYTRAIELDPRDFAGYLHRGTVRQGRRDHAGAVQDYDRAAELKPNHPDVYGGRGYARFDLGDLKGAAADLEHFLRLAPNHQNASAVRELLKKVRARLGD